MNFRNPTPTNDTARQKPFPFWTSRHREVAHDAQVDRKTVEEYFGIRKEDLESIRLFQSDYPMARCLVLYTGSRAQHEGGIDIMPATDFFIRAKEI